MTTMNDRFKGRFAWFCSRCGKGPLTDDFELLPPKCCDNPEHFICYQCQNPGCGWWNTADAKDMRCENCHAEPDLNEIEELLELAAKAEPDEEVLRVYRTVLPSLPAYLKAVIHPPCGHIFGAPNAAEAKCTICDNPTKPKCVERKPKKGWQWTRCVSCCAVWSERSNQPRLFCPSCSKRLFPPIGVETQCNTRVSGEAFAALPEISEKTVYLFQGCCFETRQEAEQEKAIIETIRSIVEHIDIFRQIDDPYNSDPHLRDQLAAHIRKELIRLLKRGET